MKRGEILTQKRKEKGLSVADLAKELNVSEWKIERWEAGELPDSEHLIGLSEALDISVEDILLGKSDSADGESENGDNTSSGSEKGEELAGLPEETSNSDNVDGADGGETTAQPVGRGPSGHNGYYAGERKFGYFVFVVFIIGVIVSSMVQFVGWVNRPRELTAENYKDYIDIDVTATRNYNPDEYIVRVTAKKDISDLSLSLEVYFTGFIAGDQTYTLVFSGNIEKNGYLERTINLTYYAPNSGYKVIDISGGLA